MSSQIIVSIEIRHGVGRVPSGRILRQRLNESYLIADSCGSRAAAFLSQCDHKSWEFRFAFPARLAGVRPPKPSDTSRKAAGWTCGRSEPLVQFQRRSLKIRMGMSLELQEDSQHGIPQEMRDVVAFVASKFSQTQKVPYPPSR